MKESGTLTGIYGRRISYQILPKVSFMLWANFHDSLPTLNMLRSRGVDVENELCVFFQKDEETTDHLLVNYHFVFEIFGYSIKAFKVAWVSPNPDQK